jgi:hypothetical protein
VERTPRRERDITSVRRELDLLAASRREDGFNPRLDARYRELCRREVELLGVGEPIRD